MGRTEVGFALSLIGGILGIGLGIIILFFSAFIFSIASRFSVNMPESVQRGGTYFIIAGIWVILTSLIVIKSGTWMKEEKTCKKGGVLALIFSIIGGGGLFGFVGGILGIVASSYPHYYDPSRNIQQPPTRPQSSLSSSPPITSTPSYMIKKKV